MRILLSISALALLVLTVVHGATAPAATAKAAQGRYDAIRKRLTSQVAAAQIAVRDDAEQAMRAPTAAEAAALGGPGGGGAEVIRSIAGGGTALKADPSHSSFSMAVVNSDGSVSVSHAGEVPHVR